MNNSSPNPTAQSHETLSRRFQVAIIMTVKNDVDACRMTLESLLAQTYRPSEIIVVDGGSTDGTLKLLYQYADRRPFIRIIERPGTNIAAGRNIGVSESACNILAFTDSGCRADPDWLADLIHPFDQDPGTDFVAGFYKIDPHTPLEQVVGLATMRGQLNPVSPESFNPSARSLACTKETWHKAGGFPDWLYCSEDTLFDLKVRSLNVNWKFAQNAVVHWRPRTGFRALARQFYHYGKGRGHTQIDAASFRYNLRNLILTLICGVATILQPWAFLALAACVAYIYLWSFHYKALRIARRLHKKSAYFLCFLVMWTVLFSNLTGYLVGTVQRLRHRERYKNRMDAYLHGVPLLLSSGMKQSRPGSPG